MPCSVKKSMILRTSFCSAQLWRIRLSRSLPIPLTCSQKSGLVLEDVERAFLMDGDNSGRQFRANAADGSRGQILLDAFRRGRMGRLKFIGLELLAKLPVDDPATDRLDMLARRYRGRIAQLRSPSLLVL